MSPPAVNPDLSDFTPDAPDLSDFKPDPPVASPISPPALANPIKPQAESVSGFINRITGHPGYQGPQINPLSIAAGTARDAKNLSILTPLQMLAQKVTGRPILGSPPSSGQVIQSGANAGTGMLLGGLEGEGVAPTQGLNQAANPIRGGGRVSTAISDPSFQMTGALARRMPVVGKFLRMADVYDAAQRRASPTPAQTPPTPAQVSAAMGVATPPEMQQGWSLQQIKQTGSLPASQSGEALGTIKPTSTATQPQVQSVPIGNLPLSKGNPYSGPRTPANMQPAQSTTISLHGYDPASQTMVVQFKNGNVYDYRGVPPEIYSQYQNSESQGSFFANNIKGRYATQLRGTVKPQAKPRAATAGGNL